MFEKVKDDLMNPGFFPKRIGQPKRGAVVTPFKLPFHVWFICSDFKIKPGIGKRELKMLTQFI